MPLPSDRRGKIQPSQPGPRPAAKPANPVGAKPAAKKTGAHAAPPSPSGRVTKPRPAGDEDDAPAPRRAGTSSRRAPASEEDSGAGRKRPARRAPREGEGEGEGGGKNLVKKEILGGIVTVIIVAVFIALRSGGSNDSGGSSQANKYNAPAVKTGGQNSNVPLVGAEEDDALAQFSKPDAAAITLDANERKSVEAAGRSYANSMTGPVFNATLYNFDRMFWEAQRRCPDDVRRNLDIGRRDRLAAFRSQVQAELEKRRKENVDEGIKIEKMDLHSVTQLAGRPELVTYWRVIYASGEMGRVALWLIRGSKLGALQMWQIYDELNIETNRRDSLETANAWILDARGMSMDTYNRAVDAANALLNSDYSTIKPAAFDKVLNNPALGYYKKFISAQKLHCMIVQPEPDEAQIHKFAKELLADEDAPAMIRQDYGVWLHNMGQHDEAIEQLAEFVKNLGPDDQTCAMLGLSYEHGKAKQRDKAAATYEQWIAVAHKPGLCHMYRGVLHVEDKEFEVAKAQLMAFLLANKDNDQLLGEVCSEYSINRAGQPLLDLIAAVKAQAASPELIYWRGRALMQLGKYDEAAKEFQAYERHPNVEADGRAEMSLYLAACDCGRGNTDKALETLRKADSENLHAAMFRAEALIKAGKDKDARKELEQLRKADEGIVLGLHRRWRHAMPGAKELWTHKEIGPWLAAWYKAITEKAPLNPESN